MTRRIIFSRTVAAAALTLMPHDSSTTAVHAETFAQTELSYAAALLRQFNLINIGNLSIGSTNGSQVYVGGRVIAGSVTAGAYGFGACVGTLVSGNSA